MIARLVIAVLLAALVATTGRAQRDERNDIIGVMDAHVAFAEDTLLDIAVEHNLGYVEITAANPSIDPWLPPEGAFIVLPTMHILPEAERRGIVINLAEMRLYWFAPGRPPVTMPIGIGTQGWESPTGKTTVMRKRTKPTWIPPTSIRAENPELRAAVPPGPDNPLGSYALDLGWPAVVVHGTNLPYAIGRRSSHGCFRLFEWDIERLYREAQIGTPVTVVNQAIKTGWRDSALYLEIHPTPSQADEIEQTGRFTPVPIPSLKDQVIRAAGASATQIDWQSVERAAAQRSGIPERITP